MKAIQMTVERSKADAEKVGMCFSERATDDLSCDRYGVRKAYTGIFDRKPQRQQTFSE